MKDTHGDQIPEAPPPPPLSESTKPEDDNTANSIPSIQPPSGRLEHCAVHMMCPGHRSPFS